MASRQGEGALLHKSWLVTMLHNWYPVPWSRSLVGRECLGGGAMRGLEKGAGGEFTTKAESVCWLVLPGVCTGLRWGLQGGGGGGQFYG